jgi:hypothetical protein
VVAQLAISSAAVAIPLAIATPAAASAGAVVRDARSLTLPISVSLAAAGRDVAGATIPATADGANIPDTTVTSGSTPPRPGDTR